MKKSSVFTLLCLACFVSIAYTQSSVPLNIGVQILRAEDARRYDKTLEDLMASPNEAVRKRAALAAGRIGSDAAIPALTSLLEKEKSEDVRAMAAFALGEIESIKAANAILKALGDTTKAETRAAGSVSTNITARLVEAAGKIAAANPKDEKSKPLGETILNVLTNEDSKQPAPSTDVVRLGLTAVLRARPTGADEIVRKFLAYSDPNIVADALNTLARLRAKNANRDARDLLATSIHAVVRANAARLLGAAEDKDALDILLKAAVNDSDSRVRVSAIRSLSALKDAKAADKLLERGEKLLSDYKKSKFANPVEKNELLEVTVALGRLLANTNNEKATKLLNDFDLASKYQVAEISGSRSRIYPKHFLETGGPIIDIRNPPPYDWQFDSSHSLGLAELAQSSQKDLRKIAEDAITRIIKSDRSYVLGDHRALPDELRAFAQFKTNDLPDILRQYLTHQDVFSRATAAELLAEQPFSDENVDALNTEFDYALKNDIQYNDAILATLDALFKLDKQGSRGSVTAFILASTSPDQLVRMKALTMLKDDAYKNKAELQDWLKSAASKKLTEVRPYAGKGTKLGQVLNTDADYRRALLRKNGMVKAILATEKGTFTIDLLPEDAPLTVDNFIKLANSRYFNGVEVHRVVPNFVMQDGDPRGDGNGGPGWSIRCEINMVPYERGAVGMALSGKDTGGSQWFVTHSPQPHLDGGYTVFGRVNETGMKVVDNIVRGDKIISVKIVEGNLPQRTRRSGQNRER